jgi:hypothetical protein
MMLSVGKPRFRSVHLWLLNWTKCMDEFSDEEKRQKVLFCGPR